MDVDAEVTDQLRSVVDQIQQRVANAANGDTSDLNNRPGSVVVLVGDDAEGRRSAASHLADALHLGLQRVDAGRLVSRWLGETERNLRKVFDERVGKAPDVLFFDEADALFVGGDDTPKRGPRDPRRDAVAAWVAHLRAERGVVVVGMAGAKGIVDAAFSRMPSALRVDLGPSPEVEDE
jgi:SpoVK/Ycf46/Vps4 family AAA+-type ATPase